MNGDAWTSGFVIVTALLSAAAWEIAATHHRRAVKRGQRRPDVEPIPWQEMERYR